jgi:hypothetical protein
MLTIRILRSNEMGEETEMPKPARLAEFIRRLAAATPANNFDEAYALLCDTMNAVEDEFTSIPYNPPTPPDDDGRLYPPFEDHRKEVKGRPDLKAYRSKAHWTTIGSNGAITIADLKGREILVKLGADGSRT